MRVGIAIILIIMCWSLKAQSTFVVQDAESNEPLIGATALVIGADGRKDQLISDNDGRFSTAIGFPFQVEIRYQGFETISQRLKSSEEVIRLSPSETSLEDVVVTGQYQPQSAKNSVYQVRTISSERIAAQNANSLHDVLSNELNVRISRDNATGRSGISLQGLSGQYVKVLMDGVPLVGKGGVSNDVDLGQIDVQRVERIEVVEGPMAVNYGADALAGVINIITKKDIEQRLEVNANLQTETAGDEYQPFDEGIYSPSVSIGYKLHPKWFTQVNGRFYRFGGWQGTAVGRQKAWHPKDQLFGGWMTRYETGNWEVYYRLDVMDELITNLGAIRELDNKEPRATDEEYHAVRFMHQIQSNLELGKATLNSVVSFTDYERLSTNYERFLESGSERQLSNGNDTIYYRSFFTRNTLNNLLSNARRSVQLGVETTRETSGGSTLSDGDKHLTDVAFFASAEFIFGKLKVRPGVRYSYNSLFETIPTPSVNFAYKVNDQTQLRWSYGRGFRAPSIRELFHEFIDSNHNLIGNPDLTPEDSHNFNVDITHEIGSFPITLNLNSFYNEINDGITVFTPDGNSATTYFNLSKYKTLGGNLRASYDAGSLKTSIGYSHIGRYQSLRDEPGVPDFVFASELVARAQYNFNSMGLNLSTFYKYTGPLNRYQQVEGEPVLVGQEGFHTLDANISKTFKSLRVGAGVRNAFDVTSINSTGGGGAHGGGSSAPIGFGRSYFLSINYQFSK